MPRLMAMVYDRSLAKTEDACLREWRGSLIADLQGEVLEVGAGTGLNLAHYGAGVTRLVLSEPDAAMRQRLERRVIDLGIDAEVVDAPAESLPFEDASFGTVVCTLVLCSVRDPAAALREMHRVLRPGGSLVYVEHVAAPAGSSRRAWQGRLEPIWKRVAGGCHVTRETSAAIAAAGFAIEDETAESLRKAVGIARPSVRGVATRV